MHWLFETLADPEELTPRLCRVQSEPMKPLVIWSASRMLFDVS